MASNEHIAHELTMLYLYNRYGTVVGGNFTNGHGSIHTFQFPDAMSSELLDVRTDEVGFLGVRKVEKMPSSSVADEYFKAIVEEYRSVYERILEMLNNS